MQHSFLKAGINHTTTTVDEQGVIIDQDITTFKYLANNKEQFCLCYASLLSIFSTGLTHPEIRVYAHLLLNHAFGAGIAMTGAMKADMAQQMIKGGKPITVGTISNTLTGLVSKGLLFTPAKGLYKLNPRYAFKGSTKERNAMLKVILQMECPDC